LRFLNFHGQQGARLNSDQTVHGDNSRKRTIMIGFLSPLLFFAPDVHLRTLEGIWVDELISLGPWKSFTAKLNAEWQEYTLFVCHRNEFSPA
jgi:hypothetical protein